MTGGPYAFHPHPVTWTALAVSVTLVLVGRRRLQHTDDPPIPWSPRQKVTFAGACVAAVVAVTWPLSDLAAHWSLTGLVAQRVILVLVVAPLLLLGLPYDVIRWLTRPPAVDAVLVRLQRPPVAIITVTAVLIGSMTPALVRAESSSVLARSLLVVAVLGAGLVLWMPVLGRIPGIPRLRPVLRFGYLVIQAVVPAFLSFIFIFSRHPLYPEFARSHVAIGLRPLNDQQVAGFVSKLSMLFVLLIVGAVVLARAPRSDEDFPVHEPLVWADVERQFERIDRLGLSGPVDQFPSAGPSADHDLSDRGRGGPEPPDGDRPDP